MDKNSIFMSNRTDSLTLSNTHTRIAMDLLTDLFRQAGLRRRLLNLRHVPAQSALQFPCDRSVGLHVVTEGAIYLHAPSIAEPLRLEAGDIAVMARGCTHCIGTKPTLSDMKRVQFADNWQVPDAPPASQATPHAVISGAYQFWHTPLHPFFQEMPDWFVLRAKDGPYSSSLTHSLKLLEQEISLHALGSESIVYGLLDVIFVLLMREIVARQRVAQPGWSHSIQDPQVHRAVLALHLDCAHQWTLEELATHAGLSRTSLAERFRTNMGNTPLNYLRTVRMQKAMGILSESDRSLEQVAQEVGYQDAFSFSKVFKRTVGVAPREFRRQDTQDKNLAWRVG
jgi:AraC-like DNA-binding protein